MPETHRRRLCTTPYPPTTHRTPLASQLSLVAPFVRPGPRNVHSPTPHIAPLLVRQRARLTVGALAQREPSQRPAAQRGGLGPQAFLCYAKRGWDMHILDRSFTVRAKRGTKCKERVLVLGRSSLNIPEACSSLASLGAWVAGFVTNEESKRRAPPSGLWSVVSASTLSFLCTLPLRSNMHMWDSDL